MNINREPCTSAITIERGRYEELVQAELKAEQYKKALLMNTSNNQMCKIMACIEGKNLYELITENEKNKEEK